MDIILIISAIALFVLVFSSGLSLGLALLRPSWSAAKRSIVSSGLGAGLPMMLAFGGLFTEVEMLWNGEASDFALGFLALLILTLALGAIAGLPGAWLVTRLLGRDGVSPGPRLGGAGADEDLLLAER